MWLFVCDSFNDRRVLWVVLRQYAAEVGDLARDVLAGENLRTVGVRQNHLSRHEPQD